MKRILCGIGIAVAVAALALTGSQGIARAAEHGGMPGMQHGSGSGKTSPATDMMKMGDKVYEGKMGSWSATMRLMDMKAHMAAMPGGMKMEGAMPNSHHLAISLTDARTKKAITEGSGSVIVTGPGGKSVKSELMAMQGHFGVDVNLPAPGKYSFKVYAFSAPGKGTATFSWTVK